MVEHGLYYFSFMHAFDCHAIGRQSLIQDGVLPRIEHVLTGFVASAGVAMMRRRMYWSNKLLFALICPASLVARTVAVPLP